MPTWRFAEIGGRHGQIEDAVLDVGEVDPERLGLRRRSVRKHGRLLHVGLVSGGRASRPRSRLALHVLLGLRALLFVALPGERRRRVVFQHDEVDRPRRPHVGVRLREPVAHRARVGRAEKVQVLAAHVEHRLAHLAEPVRNRERLVLLDRIRVNRAAERLRVHGVRDPLRVRRPRVVQIVERRVGLLRRDLLRDPALQVDPVEALRVVDVRDLLAVGRPDRRPVEAGPRDLEDARLAFAVLGGDVQRVLAGGVGEVGDLPAVRRPRGAALVRPGGARQIARVPFLARHGDDLAAELEHRPRAGRRERGVADVARAFDESRPRFAQVRGNADRQRPRRRGAGVEHVQPARLLVDDPPAAGRRAEDGKVVVPGQLPDRLRLRVVAEQVELAVPIRSKVHRVAHPHRIHVVRAVARLRDVLDGVIACLVQPDARRAAAAVVLPLQERRAERVVGDAPAVRRVGRARRVGNRQRLLDPAVHGNGEELREPGREDGARRREQHALAVGREPLHEVGAGVPREPHRHAALRGHHVHVGVPLVLRAERDPRAVGRERRTRFLTVVGREPPDVAAVQPRAPQISGVDEGHVLAARRRLRQQERVGHVDARVGSAARPEQRRRYDDQAE